MYSRINNQSLSREISVRWAIPVFLGFLFTLGDNIAINNGIFSLNLKQLSFSFISFSAAFILLFKCIDVFSKKMTLISRTVERKSTNSYLDKLKYMGRWKAIAIIASIILLGWLPWIISLYPGVYWNDTSNELLQYFGAIAFSDHHPLFMTLLLGWFASFGESLFNSASVGLFLLIMLQVCLAIFFFSALLWEFVDLRAAVYLCVPLLLFVTLFPLFPVMFSSLAKDTLSCSFFLGFVLRLVQLVKNRGELAPKWYFLLTMLIFAVVSSLLKKTVAFIVLACLLVLLMAYRKSSFRIIALFIAAFSFLVVLIIPKALIAALGATPGGKQEMIAPIIQMVAHDIKYNESDFSDKDKKLVDSFLSLDYQDIPNAYAWQIADPIKGRSLKDETQLSSFLTLWFRKAFEHPIGHLEAWTGLVDGWISFRTDQNTSQNFMFVPFYSGWPDEGIQKYMDWDNSQSKTSLQAQSVYQLIESIPFISFLFYRSFWATIIPFLALFLVLGASNNRRLVRLVLSMPILASLVPLAITPVSAFGGEPTRYVFAIACFAPFLIGFNYALDYEIK